MYLKMLRDINGGLAQLGERLPCKQEVSGSIPLISTNLNQRQGINGTEHRGIERRLLTTCRWHVVTAVAFPQKSDPANLHQHSGSEEYQYGPIAQLARAHD